MFVLARVCVCVCALGQNLLSATATWKTSMTNSRFMLVVIAFEVMVRVFFFFLGYLMVSMKQLCISDPAGAAAAKHHEYWNKNAEWSLCSFKGFNIWATFRILRAFSVVFNFCLFWFTEVRFSLWHNFSGLISGTEEQMFTRVCMHKLLFVSSEPHTNTAPSDARGTKSQQTLLNQHSLSLSLPPCTAAGSKSHELKL